MKVTYRLPQEQYAYVEVTDEISIETEASEIKAKYEQLKSAFSENPGIERKVFNAFLDSQLMEGNNDVEVYLAMNERQQLVIQEVKKAMARLKAKQ
jgi:hypothetical protein